MEHFPPIRTIKSWSPAEREQRYFQWVQAHDSSVPVGYYHPIFDWMVDILREINGMDAEVIKLFRQGEFGSLEEMRCYNPHKSGRDDEMQRAREIVIAMLEYRDTITDDVVSRFLMEITEAMPYMGPIAFA